MKDRLPFVAAVRFAVRGKQITGITSHPESMNANVSGTVLHNNLTNIP